MTDPACVRVVNVTRCREQCVEGHVSSYLEGLGPLEHYVLS